MVGSPALKIAAFAAAALLATTALAGPREPSAGKRAGAAAPARAGTTAVIPVKGMGCEGCITHVNETVQKLDGVRSVHTDLQKARTTVTFDPARVKPEQIAAAIARLGYEPGAPEVK